MKRASNRWAKAGLAGLYVAGATWVEEARSAPVTFNVGAASDYVFRGVSQTDNAPQIYGGADAEIGGIGYAGVWLSNVDFNNGTRLEYDLYAGVKPTLGRIKLDLGLNRYGYTHQPPGPREDYVEWKVAGSAPAGPLELGAAVYYADNAFGETGPATYYELNGAAPVRGTGFTVSGAVGRQIVKGPSDYTTWNLGLGYAVSRRIGLDLRYWDTDEHALGGVYDSRVALGLKATF